MKYKQNVAMESASLSSANLNLSVCQSIPWYFLVKAFAFYLRHISFNLPFHYLLQKMALCEHNCTNFLNISKPSKNLNGHSNAHVTAKTLKVQLHLTSCSCLTRGAQYSLFNCKSLLLLSTDGIFLYNLIWNLVIF